MIDVIIPAYNAHETINKTLLSICLQKIKNKITVYIVDDVSDKNYDDTINLFKDRLNIKYLKLNKNSGPGVARQYGMEHSNGEYIYFLDADDMFIDAYSLSDLVNNIGDNDILCGNVFYENYDNIIFTISNNCSFNLHGKLYKRKYIEDNKFHFNNSRNGEDNCFNRLLKIGTDKYKYINSDTEVYSYTSLSITNSIDDYCFNEVPILKTNMLWMANEADKRLFNKEKIVYELYNELVHFINMYVNYYGKKDNIDMIKDNVIELYNKTKEYKINLKYEDKKEITDGNVGLNDILHMEKYVQYSIINDDLIIKS